jgi:hypothetical protein
MRSFCFLLAVVFLEFSAQTARGDAPAHAKERLTTWKLGMTLSTAAWFHYRVGREKDADLLMDDARAQSKELGVELMPFPDKKDNDDENQGLALHYISSDGTKSIGQSLAKQYGDEVANLFELAVKSRLTVLLYREKKDDDLNAAMESALSRAGKDSALPASLWQPLVTKIKDVATEADIRKAVIQLNDDVTKHLEEEAKK